MYYQAQSKQLLERFYRYIAVDTKSDPLAQQTPSTNKQHDLAAMLYKELIDMQLSNVYYDRENCYVYAQLPSNTDRKVKSIGFLAHIDTAPDLDGKCTSPQLIDYQGGEIRLNDQYSLSPTVFPILNNFVGEQLITTDGTTLLGADDKAGMTEIMEAVKYLIEHPEIEHGTICIAFVPDEEIGHGAALLDLQRFGADFAFTVDGGDEGGIEYETFNAASAVIEFSGRNVHPGSAKDKMINASLLAMQFHNNLPVEARPELTEKRQGFFLLTGMSGQVEYAKLEYIVRDHDAVEFKRKKQILLALADIINLEYPDSCQIAIRDSYKNMGEIIKEHPEIVELAYQAMREVGVKPFSDPVRGGTDGAQLSFRGLPCPNLFTGGYNYHGRYEFAVVSQMENAVRTIIAIASAQVR